MNELIPPFVQVSRDKIKTALEAIYEITKTTANTELSDTTMSILHRVDEPFLFVIVGEVKSGKSSFINALLGSQEQIVKVAP